MTEEWIDERLDRFASKVDRQCDRIDVLVENFGQLVQALYLELPGVKAELNSVGAEAKEQREGLHAEMIEHRESVRQEAKELRELFHTEMTEIKEVVKQQAKTAQTQAESIRMMIEMMNRKLA